MRRLALRAARLAVAVVGTALAVPCGAALYATIVLAIVAEELDRCAARS